MGSDHSIFAQLFDQSPYGVAVFDTEMRYLFCNQKWCVDSALRESPIGKCHYDVFPVSPAARDVHRRCLAGSVERSDAEALICGGKTIWIRWEVRPWRDDQGMIGGLIVYVEDVSEKVAFEAERARVYAENEAKFAALFGQSALPKALLEWPAGRFLDVNAAWTRLFGFTADEVRGQTAIELGMVRGSESAVRLLTKMERGDHVLDVETVGYAKDGRPLLVSVNAACVEWGGRKHILSTQVDITEKRKLERQLVATFDQAEVGIALVSPEGAWLKVNRKLREIVGYEEHELLGKSFQEITHSDDLDTDLELVRRVLRKEIDHYTLEKRYIRKDGSIVWINLTVGLVTKPGGEPDYFVSTIEDITERRRAEAEHRDLLVREKLALEATSLKSEFLARMSHEIRTPINGILGMANLLRDTPLTNEQREYLGALGSSAESLMTVVSDILDFSKIEANRLEFEEMTFDLWALLSDVDRSFRFLAERRGIALVLELAEGTPRYIRGDAGRLRQVFNNLVGNAIKFTERGKVVVRAQILKILDAGSARFRFEIQDSGIGIPESALSRMFQAFSQADASMSRRYGGTGLGLSICKHLVERMGGAIGVTSQENRGSLFWFEAKLGLSEESVEQPENESWNIAARLGRRPRILVAEDNLVNQRIAVCLLEKLGARADAVADGNEAIDALRQISYDLVFMDCQMPEMDGYQATRLIRESASMPCRNIPIVAITANAVKGDRERCLEVGMNDYLTKPLSPAALGEMILRWLLPAEPRESDLVVEPKEAGRAPALAPTVGAPMIDELAIRARVRALEIPGKEDLAANLITLFLESAPALIRAILEAVGQRDIPRLAAVSHQLGSSAGNLGAADFSRLAREVEQAALASELTKAAMLARQLSPRLENLRVILLAAAARPESRPADSIVHQPMG